MNSHRHFTDSWRRRPAPSSARWWASLAVLVSAFVGLPLVVTSLAQAAPAVAIAQFPVQGLCSIFDTFGDVRPGGTDQGVVIVAGAGHKVYAADRGTLTKKYIDVAGSNVGNGWQLTRADGVVFEYAHLHTFATGLKVGSKVAAGQIIGDVGATGNAGQPMLHFEVHPGGGAATNPFPIVKAVDGCATSVVPPQPTATTTTTTTKPTTTTSTTTTMPATTTTTTAPPPPGLAAHWQFIPAVRALDTGGVQLAAGSVATLQVNDLLGVPATAPGVMVRIAAPNASAIGNLLMFPCGAPPPRATTLSLVPGRMNATTTIVPVVRGNICLTNSVAVAVRVEVIAYQGAAGVGLRPFTPRRALDTRSGSPVLAGHTVSASLAALGVAAGDAAVSVVVSIATPTDSGTIAIGPCGGSAWVQRFAHQPNQVFSAVVPVSGSGVCITPSRSVHLVVVATGAWTGVAGAAAVAPVRLYDSRASGAITTVTKKVLLALPKGSTRAQLTVVAVGGATTGVLTAWSCLDARPSVALVSVLPGSLASVTMSFNASGGALCLASNGSMHAVVDLAAVG